MDSRVTKCTPAKASSLADDASSSPRGVAPQESPAPEVSPKQQKAEVFAAPSDSEDADADHAYPSPSDCSETSPKRACPAGNPWLLQAAEMVFASSSISPDVLTEEPVGERRPLLLAAIAEAIEGERAVTKAAEELKLETDGSISECQKTLQRTLDEAFDLVRLLLARGASPSVPSEKGVFPLEYAIKKHSLRAAALLLAPRECSKKKSKGCFPLPDGLTPLHVASAANDLNLATLLLSKDASNSLQASARCQNCRDRAAIAVACTPPAPKGLRQPPAVSVSLPLCRSCLVKARDERNCTAAFYCGSSSMLRLLLDSGTPLELRSSAGDTLLHALVYNARRFVEIEPISVAHEAGEDEMGKGTQARPSQAACWCKDCRGAGGNPRGSALCRILLLLERVASQASVNPNPGESGNSKAVTDFINTRNHAGWTALHLAASRGYSDICKVLLDYGANASLTTKKRRLRPESLALMNKHFSTARLLRESVEIASIKPPARSAQLLYIRLKGSAQSHPLLAVLGVCWVGLLCLHWQGVVAALQVYFPSIFGQLL